MRIITTLFTTIFLLSSILNAQTVSEKLENFHSSHHTEKIYISHDKPVYYVGDTVWAQVFFVDGRTHKTFDASPVVFVDWLEKGGELIQSLNLKIKDGSAPFDIAIAKEDTPGVYILRAYTQYQRNFAPEFAFQQEIRVLGKNEQISDTVKKEITDFEVNFYPEGGYLINGIASNLAFEAKDQDGEPIELMGEILDENENVITSLKIVHEGIGIQEFTPEKGKSYFGRFYTGDILKTFPLPEPLPAGFTLKANSVKKDYITLNLASNLPTLLNGTKLIGHIRGQIFMTQEFGSIPQKELLIKKELLPSGILHFTLFDSEERPVCERLVFNQSPLEQVEVPLTTEKSFYGPRNLVKGKVSNLLNGESVPARLSISVFNRDLIQENPYRSDIHNYLLLQSDLPGRIKNIGQYFQNDDLKTNVRRDLLLLTHGWRRFKWQEILNQENLAFSYPIKDDLAVIGKVTHAKTGEEVKADVSLTAMVGEDFMSFKLTTDEDGLFLFKGFQFNDTADIFIQGNIHNPKKQKKLKEGEMKRIGNKNVSMEMLELNQWNLPSDLGIKNFPPSTESPEKQVAQLEQFRKIDSAYQASFEITLDEVSITGKRTTREKNKYLKEKFKKKGIFYFSTTYKVLLDDLPDKGKGFPTIYDLINMMIPKTTILGSPSNRTVRFRNRDGSYSEPALIVVDGIPLAEGATLNLKPEQVEIIDLRQDLYASSYDEPNVIIVITREPGTYKITNPGPKPKGVINYQHPGYYQAREFYKPDYTKSSITFQKPDYRTTIFWDPNIRIKNKAREFEFYTGDLEGKYLIKVEGITDGGIPFVGTQEIEVVR